MCFHGILFALTEPNSNTNCITVPLLWTPTNEFITSWKLIRESHQTQRNSSPQPTTPPPPVLFGWVNTSANGRDIFKHMYARPFNSEGPFLWHMILLIAWPRLQTMYSVVPGVANYHRKYISTRHSIMLRAQHGIRNSYLYVIICATICHI